MIKRTLLLSSILIFAFTLTACGSSPNAKFYILNSIDRADSISTANQKNQKITVKVGPVTIPDTLDQSQIVTRSGENMLILDEFNRWGGDFQSDIQRILGENISILLPSDQIILSPEITLLATDYQVIVNIREFDGNLGGMVTLNADWTVASKTQGKSVTAHKSVLQQQAEGIDYQAYVAAQSSLLARLSKAITVEIKRQLQQ